MTEERNYQGLALLWVRTVLGKTSPKFRTVRDFADHYRAYLHHEPEVGEVCIWLPKDPASHGNIGLYLGAGRIAVLGAGGIPTITTLRADDPTYAGAMPWPEYRS